MADFWGQEESEAAGAQQHQPDAWAAQSGQEWGSGQQQQEAAGGGDQWGSAPQSQAASGGGGFEWGSGAAAPQELRSGAAADSAPPAFGEPPQSQSQRESVSQQSSTKGSPNQHPEAFPASAGPASAGGSAIASAAHSFNATTKSTGSTGGVGSLGAGSVPTAEEAMKQAEAEVLARGKEKFEAEKKAIAERTAQVDKKNSEGLTAMKQEATVFHKAQQQKRDEHIASSKKAHRDAQKAQSDRVQSLQKGGHLWEQVGEIVDTGKPNKFSAKSTDRMRNLLIRLKAAPNAKQLVVA